MLKGEVKMSSFVTTQDLSDYLGRDVTNDPGAEAAVSSACAVIRSITGQDFDAATATISLDGTGSDALVLPQLPATAGTVVVNGEAVTDWTVTEIGVLLRGTAGADPRPVWPAGRQNVQVTYDHGYATLQVPEEICQVALDLAARRVVQGVAASESVGDVSVSYAQAVASDLTKTELMILKGYTTTRSF